MSGIRIDELETVDAANREHLLPAMLAGQTVALTVAQILGQAEALNLPDGIVTNAKLASMAAARIKGAVNAGPPIDLTPEQARAILGIVEASAADIYNAVAERLISANVLRSARTPTVLSASSSTISWNLTTQGEIATVTLPATRTLGNPSGQWAGATGYLFVNTSATRVLNFDNQWVPLGGTPPGIHTGAGWSIVTWACPEVGTMLYNVLQFA